MADKPKRKLKKKNKAAGGDKSALVTLLIGVGILLMALVVAAYLSIGTTEEFSEVSVVAEDTGTGDGVDEDAMAARPPYDRGVFYLSEGRFLAAADAFTEAIEQNPDNTDAWYGRARAYHGVGDFDVAVTAYNRLLTDNPNYDYRAWYGLADLYWEQYQRTDAAVHLPDAAAAVERAVALMEQGGEARPEVYRLAGNVADQLGNPDEALDHYEAYLEAAPVPSPAIAARVAELQRQ
jgi:tetratricopeptide (TPR) repeat protein